MTAPVEAEAPAPRPRCEYRDPRTALLCRNVVSIAPARVRSEVSVEAGELAAARCSWHDPARRARQRERQRATVEANTAPKTTVNLDDLPVETVESLEDALALARWLPTAIATGRIGGREAAAMVSSLREYRMIAADADALARLAALEERLEAAKKKGLDV